MAIAAFAFLTLSSCRSTRPLAKTTPADPIVFSDYFLDKTMRMDFYHSVQ